METTEHEHKPETLGRRVASRRALKGWTQVQLGKEIELHPMQVSRIEADVSSPSFPTAVALARAFGVTLDWLAFGDENRQVDAA